MGKYTAKPLDTPSYKKLIEIIRNGYTDQDGHKHRPNDQIATILVLQGNLGCRIGDIVNIRMENIEWDGEAWRLNLSEQKTKKKRYFVIPSPVKEFIDGWTQRNHIESGRLFGVTKANVWFHLRSATEYLGLEETSSHSIRKMAGQNLYYNSGMDLALTAQYYNHSSATTTLLYLKKTTKQMDEVLSHSVSLA